MSLTDFLHGIETVTVDKGARPIQTVRSAVIGLIGTAPLASTAAFPLDTPVLVNRRSDMAGLGATGTLPVALDSIFDQIGALVVVVRVEASETENVQLGNVIGGVNAGTGALAGVHAFRKAESLHGVSPMILIAPGFTHQRPIGLTSLPVTDEGDNYTVATVTFAGGGDGAILPVVTATIEEGKIKGFEIVSPGFNITGALTATLAGDGEGAELGAPTTGATTNPVVGEMLSIANAMRAHIIVDGPSTTDSAAIAYRNDFGSRRVFIVDPKVSGWNASTDTYVVEPSSARVAGLIAKTDNDFGFWESPSNKEIFGIGGLARPIDFLWGDKTSRANVLNENEITTFIRDEGWYLWGNRTASRDPKFAFLSVSRTADMVDISIAKAHRYAVDRAITRNYFDDVTSSVKAYLRQLQARGAILGGDCWVDPEFNTEADISNGNATFDYDFTPPYPAERVTFRSHLVTDYIRNLFA